MNITVCVSNGCVNLCSQLAMNTYTMLVDFIGDSTLIRERDSSNFMHA